MHSPMKKNILNIYRLATTPTEYRALDRPWWQMLEHFLFEAWWMICFIIVSYMIYEHSLKSLSGEYTKLHKEYVGLQFEKKQALEVQTGLLLQINSQSDQDWIELTLMKGLGLAPEEQNKVFFTHE
jgi:hypothetical protein